MEMLCQTSKNWFENLNWHLHGIKLQGQLALAHACPAVMFPDQLEKGIRTT